MRTDFFVSFNVQVPKTAPELPEKMDESFEKHVFSMFLFKIKRFEKNCSHGALDFSMLFSMHVLPSRDWLS